MDGMEVPEGKVKLISSDNIEFIIDMEIASLSNTLKIFFDREYPFIESQTRMVTLPIRSQLLNRIIEFMEYKHKYGNGHSIVEFKISDDETMELLDVASYLRI